MARCPECNAVLAMHPGITLYDRVHCGDCGALLEVVSLSPAELEYVYDYADLGDEDDILDWEDLDEEDSLDFLEEGIGQEF